MDIGSNEPLGNGGVTCWEGGIRVAAMARWPGHIQAGTVSAQPLWSPDLMIACARLGGAELPRGRPLSMDVIPLPVLTDGAASPHRSLYFTFRSHAALRMGDWKIVRSKPNQPWKLFDLGTDVSESSDLAAHNPARLLELGREFSRWQGSFFAIVVSSRRAENPSNWPPSSSACTDPVMVRYRPVENHQ